MKMKTFVSMFTALTMMTSTASLVPASADTGTVTPYTISYSSYSASSSSVAQVKVKKDYSSSDSAVVIRWNKVKNASGYRVYRKINGKWTKLATIKNGSTCKYRDEKGLSPATKYQYKVKAYKKSKGKTIWGKASSAKNVVTRPETVTFKGFGATTNKIRVNWEPVNCTGYQLYMLQSDGSYKKIVTIKDANTSTYLVKNLSADTKYTFKIRAYTRDADGTFKCTVCSKKTKTTKFSPKGSSLESQLNDVEKAYYRFICNDFTDEDFAVISADLLKYAHDNYDGKSGDVEFKDPPPYTYSSIVRVKDKIYFTDGTGLGVSHNYCEDGVVYGGFTFNVFWDFGLNEKYVSTFDPTYKSPKYMTAKEVRLFRSECLATVVAELERCAALGCFDTDPERYGSISLTPGWFYTTYSDTCSPSIVIVTA